MVGQPLFQSDTIILVAIGLCALAVVMATMVPIVGTLFDLIGMVGGLLTGDPSSCCGCILLLSLGVGAACIGAFLLSLLSTCGTPDAVAFCTWIGR